MTGRKYSVSFEEVGITAIQDLFQFEAKTVPAILYAAVISQNTDVGDAAAENLTIRFRRVTDAVATPSSLSSVKLDNRDSASLANFNINDVTPLTTGAETIHAECWNIALPWVWYPQPDLRIIVPVDDAVTLNLPAAPTDSLTCCGTLYFEEIG